MKKLLLVFGLLLSSNLYQPAQAQVNVSINIGSQPLWGPVGYNHVDYYYFPDLDIYYYVPQQQWIYFNGATWIPTPILPPQYSQYDLYQLHKVVINEKQPYLRNATYRTRYASFRGQHDQQPIRDSRDTHYAVIKNHPMNGPTAGARPMGNPVQNSANRQVGSRNDRPGGNGGLQQATNRSQRGNGGPQGNQRGNGSPQDNQRGPR